MSLPLGKYQRYVHLVPNERYAVYRSLEVSLGKLCAKLRINVSDIECRKDVIFDIIERVAMRRVYFYVFHNKKMSEQNAIAHYCFWILKLAPLFNKQCPNQHINTLLAIFLFVNMLKRVGRAKNKSVVFNHKFVQNIAYAFVYRDVSKEAIMAIADALLA